MRFWVLVFVLLFCRSGLAQRVARQEAAADAAEILLGADEKDLAIVESAVEVSDANGIVFFEFECSEAFEAIGELIRGGAYREGLVRLDAEFGPEQRTSAEYWYWRGLALLGLEDDLGGGLCFMRAVLAEEQGTFWAMALYRVAQVHERLGRFDIALSLYQQLGALPSSLYNSQPRGRAVRRLRALGRLSRDDGGGTLLN